VTGDVEEKAEYGKSEASEKEKEDKVTALPKVLARELREVREKACDIVANGDGRAVAC